MIRSAAITRIQDGLGFAIRQSDKIILRLQEAQRELEAGKTLPKFLLQEEQPLSLVAGSRTVVLPERFLRIDDDYMPYFIASGATAKTYVPIIRSLGDALRDNVADGAGTPPVIVVRKNVLDFVVVPDVNYTIIWQYYKGAELLTSEIENDWLAHAPDWLIGEAGWRMAMDARDKDAMTLFDALRKSGRAATFGEVIASEEASGMLQMGMNL
jgi:hypothetical protein